MDELWGYLVASFLAMGGILFWSVKRGVQAWLDSKLKVLGTELDKEISDRQNLNAISRPTFERIFSKKVEVYTELSKIKNEFIRYKNESHEPAVSDNFESVTNRFEGYFERCRNVIEINKLYISSELSEKYDVWYQLAYPYYQESEIDGYEVYSSSWGAAEDVANANFASLGALSAMIQETMPQMEAIFAQVDQDIACIREYVDMAIRVNASKI